MAVAVDAYGNVLLGGDYGGSGHFGGEPLPNHGTGSPRPYVPGDDRDAVVAKYSPSGEHLWSLGFGHAGGSAWVKDVALQGSEVLAVGESTAGLEVKGAKVPAGPFLLRLDEDGRLLRAVSLEVPAEHVVVEPSGAMVVAGVRMTLDGSPRATLSLSRLDTQGTVLWRRELSAEGPAFIHALERDGSGHLYMAGEFEGALGLGSVRVPAGAAGRQPYVAKLSPDGEVLWARSFSQPLGSEGGSTASVLGLAVGADGQVLVSGHFGGELDFDGERHAAMSSRAGFLAALGGSDGKARWVRWLSPDGSASLSAVRVDARGDVITTGLFHGTVLVGGLPLTNRHEYGASALVAKYHPSGEHVWSRVLSNEPGILDVGTMACAPSGRVVFPVMVEKGEGQYNDIMLWGLLP
jgi:outer membrane protein assembly factor BamB